ncbi:MAG: DsbE family thiol:disulfide interchange protein [Pseudomonadota bacterium]
MVRFYVPVVALVVLAGFLWAGLQRDPGELPSPFIGKPAPAFTLPSLYDETVTFSQADLTGRVALVNVWGTWCPGCQTEHPVLMRMAEAGVPIYSINWKDDDALAKRWLAQLGDPYVLTGADRAGQAAIDWGVYGAPETFVIDAGGVVRYKHIGPITDALWQEVLLPAMREAGEATTAQAATGRR